ncbi:MAG: alpha/beta hydrolase family protein [Rheinheimera sp.]
MTVVRTLANSNGKSLSTSHGNAPAKKRGNTTVQPIALGLLLALCPLTVLAKQSTPEQLYPALTTDVLPELAAAGTYAVGVKTVQVTDPARFDLQTQAPKPRKLTLEIWYPAATDTSKAFTSYENQGRSGVPFSLQATAMRDVPVLKNGKEKYPLVVLSHGYTGYRTIMFYLGEHLAAQGYIVVGIDHTDSTNAEIDMKTAPFAGFVSTLLNRSRDQQFVLEHLRREPALTGSQLDGSKAAVIGYSMGGFGALSTIGACYDFNPMTTAAFTGLKDPTQLAGMQQLLNSCAGGQYPAAPAQAKNTQPTPDPAWQAAIALAPWGGQHQLFSAASLASIKVPVLYVAGDLDDISGYAGIESLYQQTGSSAKYLLTYHNARHNIAPHPAPAAASGNELDIGHYHEPAWSVRTINEVNKHFTLAMLDCHVKQQKARCAYLDLPPSPDQKPVDGKTPETWRGFDNRYATGMSWQQGAVKP